MGTGPFLTWKECRCTDILGLLSGEFRVLEFLSLIRAAPSPSWAERGTFRGNGVELECCYSVNVPMLEHLFCQVPDHQLPSSHTGTWPKVPSPSLGLRRPVSLGDRPVPLTQPFCTLRPANNKGGGGAKDKIANSDGSCVVSATVPCTSPMTPLISTPAYSCSSVAREQKLREVK